LIRVLLLESLVFFLEILGEHRHGCGGNVQRAECPAKRLDGGHDLGILTVAAAFEVTERGDFDEIKERHCLVPARFVQLPIKVPPHGHKLLGQPFLLVVAAAV